MYSPPLREAGASAMRCRFQILILCYNFFILILCNHFRKQPQFRFKTSANSLENILISSLQASIRFLFLKQQFNMSATDNISRQSVVKLTSMPSEGTPLIALFKKNFRKSALKPEDFRIDPFSFNTMSQWYEAIVKDDEEASAELRNKSVPAQPEPLYNKYADDNEYDSDVSEPSPSVIQTFSKRMFKLTGNENGLTCSPGNPDKKILAAEEDSGYSTHVEDQGDYEPLYNEFFSPEPINAFDVESIVSVCDDDVLPTTEGTTLIDATFDTDSDDETYIKSEPTSPVSDSDSNCDTDSVVVKSEPSSNFSNSDKENQYPEAIQDLAAQHAFYPYSSDSTITNPDYPSAYIDFNYQEPSFEHAVDLVLPPLPEANIRFPPVWTPIIDRRLATSHGDEDISQAHAAVASLSRYLSQNSVTNNSKPFSKKRSASSCRTPRSSSSSKRPRQSSFDGSCSALIADIAAQLGVRTSHNSLTPTVASLNHDAGISPIPEILDQIRAPNTPVSASWRTYPGQFHGLSMSHLVSRSGRTATVATFPEGPVRNANGSMIHQACVPARGSACLDFSSRFRSGKWRKTTRAEEELYSLLETKTILCGADSVSASRGFAQKDLRARLHSEAAQARLDGVSVGEVRYYDGCMTVEEFVGTGVCVCWEKCACSAVCTRYPDMVCPCSELIVVEE